jgi:hypothetical protein
MSAETSAYISADDSESPYPGLELVAFSGGFGIVPNGPPEYYTSPFELSETAGDRHETAETDDDIVRRASSRGLVKALAKAKSVQIDLPKLSAEPAAHGPDSVFRSIEDAGTYSPGSAALLGEGDDMLGNMESEN